MDLIPLFLCNEVEAFDLIIFIFLKLKLFFINSLCILVSELSIINISLKFLKREFLDANNLFNFIKSISSRNYQ